MTQTKITIIDERGRIVIPKEWRTGKLRDKKVILRLDENGSIEILTYRSLDLTRYFDTVAVDVKTPLSDLHRLKRELNKRRDWLVLSPSPPDFRKW